MATSSTRRILRDFSGMLKAGRLSIEQGRRHNDGVPLAMLPVEGKDGVRLVLHLRELGKVRPKGLIQAIGGRLKRAGLQKDEEKNENAALLVLALAILLSDNSTSSAVEWLERMLDNTCEADVYWNVYFPEAPRWEGAPKRIGGLSLGPFNPDPLLRIAGESDSRCQFRSRLSDYRGLSSLSGPARRLSIVDWPLVLSVMQNENRPRPAGSRRTPLGPPEVLQSALMDRLMELVWLGELRRIEDEVRREMLPAEAFGMLGFSLESLLAGSQWRAAAIVNIKSSQRHRASAWALERGVLPHSMNVPAQALVDNCMDWAADAGFSGKGVTGPLGPSITAYARLLQEAHRHRIHRRPDEAHLHFVIGLELLFGGGTSNIGSIGDSIARRTSTIAHRGLGEDREALHKELKGHYKARSSLVHSGKSPLARDVARIEKICHEVLLVLLGASRQQDVSSLDVWVKEIDALTGDFTSEFRSPDDVALSRVGIPACRRSGNPPNRIREDRSQFDGMDLDDAHYIDGVFVPFNVRTRR